MVRVKAASCGFDTVTGSLSYTTEMGGSTTVPELQVDSITVTGHASS